MSRCVLPGEAEVQIRVTDMNDNSPFFRDNLYTTRVPENTDPGTVIITVTAEDRDEGLFRGIASGLFLIKRNFNSLSFRKQVDLLNRRR